MWTVVDDDDESYTELPAIVQEAKGAFRLSWRIPNRTVSEVSSTEWTYRELVVHVYPHESPEEHTTIWSS